MQDLTDDIRAHGLIAPIVLFEGMISGRAKPRGRLRARRRRSALCIIRRRPRRRFDLGGFAQPQAASLTKQAIADALVAAEDFDLHYTLAEPAAAAEAGADGPEAQSVIKITEPKTASSRKLAQAAGRVVSHVMIAATRKVKEKGEPELQEAVKRGRIGVQDAAKAADLPPEQQKAIAGSPKPRRAAAEAAEAAKSAVSRAGGARHEARSTGTRRCARRGRRQRRCAASGRQRTTEPKNGLSARFCSIRTSLANRPGSYQFSLAIPQRLAKANPGSAGWPRYLAQRGQMTRYQNRTSLIRYHRIGGSASICGSTLSTYINSVN